MDIAQAVNYKVMYEDVDGIEVFTGVYKGINNNGSHVFINYQDETSLIVGWEDIVEVVTNGMGFKNTNFK